MEGQFLLLVHNRCQITNQSNKCLADLQKMKIKPMDGVTVEGAQRFKGSSAFRKHIDMRFDLRNLEYIDLQIISEFETTFQKIKTQINESLPAEGETDEDDACMYHGSATIEGPSCQGVVSGSLQ